MWVESWPDYKEKQIEKLQSRVDKLEQHMEIAGKSIQNLDYEISVLADLQRNTK